MELLLLLLVLGTETLIGQCQVPLRMVSVATITALHPQKCVPRIVPQLQQVLVVQFLSLGHIADIRLLMLLLLWLALLVVVPSSCGLETDLVVSRLCPYSCSSIAEEQGLGGWGSGSGSIPLQLLVKVVVVVIIH